MPAARPAAARAAEGLGGVQHHVAGRRASAEVEPLDPPGPDPPEPHAVGQGEVRQVLAVVHQVERADRARRDLPGEVPRVVEVTAAQGVAELVAEDVHGIHALHRGGGGHRAGLGGHEDDGLLDVGPGGRAARRHPRPAGTRSGRAGHADPRGGSRGAVPEAASRRGRPARGRPAGGGADVRPAARPTRWP